MTWIHRRGEEYVALAYFLVLQLLLLLQEFLFNPVLLLMNMEGRVCRTGFRPFLLCRPAARGCGRIPYPRSFQMTHVLFMVLIKY
jgi:hypothetical protein